MTQEPRWEMTEHGWHGVAVLTGGIRWHAYVEHVDASQHCTWAGTSFESLREAQDWCRSEIALLRSQNRQPEAAMKTPAAPSLDAWSWLWETLIHDVGEQRALQIREEFIRRQQADTSR